MTVSCGRDSKIQVNSVGSILSQFLHTFLFNFAGTYKTATLKENAFFDNVYSEISRHKRRYTCTE